MSARVQLTEVEQNQLVVDHVHMVPKIAWKYRRWKGFEFEELVSEGKLGLVVAARTWEGRAAFSSYAYLKIRGFILDFIKKQSHFVPHSGGECEVHLLLMEWQGGAVIDGWDSLPTTPAALAGAFETIRYSDALGGALATLTRRELRMVKRYLIKEPKKLLAEVAREEEMSYRRAMVIVRNAVRKLRACIKSSQRLTNDRFQIANIIERAEAAAFLPAPVNNRTASQTGGNDVQARRSATRQPDRVIPRTRRSGGGNRARGVKAPVLSKRRDPRASGL